MLKSAAEEILNNPESGSKSLAWLGSAISTAINTALSWIGKISDYMSNSSFFNRKIPGTTMTMGTLFKFAAIRAMCSFVLYKAFNLLNIKEGKLSKPL